MRIAENEYVDKAILGNPGNKYQVIENENPDVLCFGYDQKSFNVNIEVELAQRKLSPKIVKLKAFHPDKYKSSKFGMFHLF